MKFLVKSMLLCFALALVPLHGETVFIGSNPFSFPAMTGIKTQPYMPKPSLFTVQRAGKFSHSVTFSWNFPSRKATSDGMITVYSLLGKVVARIPVTAVSGSVNWDFSRTFSRNGLYIARIRFGTESRNLKLMLWN